MPKDLVSQAVRIVVRDVGAAGAVVFDAQIPGLTAPKCDPRDGWASPSHNKTRYRLYGDALPPDCLPGSGQGLRQYDVRWTGTAYVRIRIDEATLPAVVGPIQVELYRGTGPANECDGFIGDAPCVVGPGSASCSQ
jgi:hypothetical protein